MEQIISKGRENLLVGSSMSPNYALLLVCQSGKTRKLTLVQSCVVLSSLCKTQVLQPGWQQKNVATESYIFTRKCTGVFLHRVFASNSLTCLHLRHFTYKCANKLFSTCTDSYLAAGLQDQLLPGILAGKCELKVVSYPRLRDTS